MDSLPAEPPGKPIQSYYYIINIIINHIPYIVYYITMTSLSYIWKLVTLNSLHLFCPHPTSFPLRATSLLSAYMNLLLFVFIDCTYKWEYAVFVFLCLPISLSIILLRFIPIAENIKISIFYGLVISHCSFEGGHYYIYHSLDSGQTTGRGTQPHSSADNWIKDLLSIDLPTRARSRFSQSQSLPSGSFHKPLIVIHQRAERMKSTITEN